MIAKIRTLFADPSVRWLAAARLIPLVVAPLTLWLLVTRQPPSARGFYLIAINVVMMAQLFETGMGTLVVQFATRVRPSERGILRGAAERWFMRAALACLAIGAAIGLFVFTDAARPAGVAFVVPWTIVVLCTAAYVRLVPLVCLREGGGDAEAVQRMRAVQAGAVSIVLVMGLLRGRGIMAAAAAAMAQLAALALYIWMERRRLPEGDPPAGRLADQFRTEQNKSARVWLALWAAPQLLTPATMLLRGATEAGEVGLHVALALAPPILAGAWMHARYPRLGALVASGALRTFDETALHAFRQAMLVYGGAALAVLALPFLIPVLLPSIPARLLSPSILLLLLGGNFALVCFQAMLAWFRAFGDEKLSSPVVIACTAMAVGGIGGAALGGPFGAVAGYAAVGVGVTAILATGFARLRAQRLAGA
jgi:hypothetical protein